MKKLFVMLSITLLFSLPGVKEINAYKDYESDFLIMEEPQETYAMAPSLRHR
ncbi:hypothetical protein [Alkaliphilus crotonatoxidans]